MQIWQPDISISEIQPSQKHATHMLVRMGSNSIHATVVSNNTVVGMG